MSAHRYFFTSRSKIKGRKVLNRTYVSPIEIWHSILLNKTGYHLSPATLHKQKRKNCSLSKQSLLPRIRFKLIVLLSSYSPFSPFRSLLGELKKDHFCMWQSIFNLLLLGIHFKHKPWNSLCIKQKKEAFFILFIGYVPLYFIICSGTENIKRPNFLGFLNFFSFFFPFRFFSSFCLFLIWK